MPPWHPKPTAETLRLLSPKEHLPARPSTLAQVIVCVGTAYKGSLSHVCSITPFSVWSGKTQPLNNRGNPTVMDMRCVNVSKSGNFYLLFSWWDPQTTVIILCLSLCDFSIVKFSTSFCFTWKWKHKMYFILMALIRLTVIESFGKHNVILGESAQNWLNDWIQMWVSEGRYKFYIMMICCAKSDEWQNHQELKNAHRNHATEHPLHP